MNNWVPKRKSLQLTVLATLCSLLIYIFGIYSVATIISDIELSLQESRAALNREEAGQLLKKTLEDNAGYIDTIRDFFVVQGDEVEFIETIESMGQRSGVDFEISNINPVKSKDESAIKEDISVRVNVEGSWVECMTFFALIEKMPFGVFVENVSLDSLGKGDWSGSVQFLVFREKKV